MSYTKQNYISTLKINHPQQKIKMTTLIETIIKNYGKDYSMPEDKLNNILDIIFGDSEFKDAAFAICNDKTLASKFNFHFDTTLGEGFITLK